MCARQSCNIVSLYTEAGRNSKSPNFTDKETEVRNLVIFPGSQNCLMEEAATQDKSQVSHLSRQQYFSLYQKLRFYL